MSGPEPVADLSSAWAIQALTLPADLLDFIAEAPSEALAATAWKALLPSVKSLWRKRLQEVHPDHGGSAELFDQVQRAWDLVQHELFAVAYWTARQREGSNVSPPCLGAFSLRDPPFLRR
jgi:hypothetical protein